MSQKLRSSRTLVSSSPANPAVAPTMAESDSPENFQAFVVSSLKQLNNLPNEVLNIKTAIDDLSSDCRDMKYSLEYSNAQVEKLQEELQSQKGEIAALRLGLLAERKSNHDLTVQVAELHEHNIQLEMYSRRHNVIIEGLDEKENENIADKFVACLLEMFQIRIDPHSIDKVHRFGRSVNGRPRPVVARFTTHSQRDTVLFSYRNMRVKPNGVYINEDLPQKVKSRRSEIRAVYLHAKAKGAKAKLLGDKVIINDVPYIYDSLPNVPKQFSLEAARTVEVNDETIGFYSRHSFLSNLSPCVIECDGRQFVSAEQLYQKQKADFAGRPDVAVKNNE